MYKHNAARNLLVCSRVLLITCMLAAASSACVAAPQASAKVTYVRHIHVTESIELAVATTGDFPKEGFVTLAVCGADRLSQRQLTSFFLYLRDGQGEQYLGAQIPPLSYRNGRAGRFDTVVRQNELASVRIESLFQRVRPGKPASDSVSHAVDPSSQLGAITRTDAPAGLLECDDLLPWLRDERGTKD
jgi:hypothetical protein